MLLKSTTLCFVALALFGCLCDAQLYKQGSQRPYDQQKPSDPQQSKHTFDKPFTWKYPKDPVEPPKPVIAFEQRYPIAATTVAVECREKDARVEVQKDLFGIGQLINPSDLLLGDCFAVAEDPTAQVLIFESELHQCGSISLVSMLKKKPLFLKIRSIHVMIKWCPLQIFHFLLTPLPSLDGGKLRHLQFCFELQSFITGQHLCREDQQSCYYCGMPLCKVCGMNK